MKSQEKVKELVKESVAADMTTTTGFGGEPLPAGSPKKDASDISHMIRLVTNRGHMHSYP